MKQTEASFYFRTKHSCVDKVDFSIKTNIHSGRVCVPMFVFVFVFAFKLVPADILRAYSDSARVSMII